MHYIKNIARQLGLRRIPRADDRFNYLPDKQYAALKFWDSEVDQWIKWYQGEIDNYYNSPTPIEAAKVKDYGLRTNAIMTWVQRDPDKYPQALRLSRDYFAGKTVLDVGCGPVPYMMAFADCTLYGLDNLIEEFKIIGFPLELYSDRLTYIHGSGEDIPLEDNTIDAVISVNAIDHVDNFEQTAREITRVLKPGGMVRMQIHYHKPTLREPWVLNDEIITKCYGHLGFKKIHSEPYTNAPSESMTVWSTD